MYSSGPGALPKLGMLAVVLACAGCGGSPPCKLGDSVTLQLEGSDRMNTDAEGRSLPTIIRVYQLKDIHALELATFEDLWQRQEETLGDSLLGVDELTLYPGQRMARKLKRNPEASYVVAAGIFRRPAGSTWRDIVQLPKPGAPCPDGEETPPEIMVEVTAEDYRIHVASPQAVEKATCPPDQPDCQAGGSEGEVPEEVPTVEVEEESGGHRLVRPPSESEAVDEPN